MWDFLLDFIYSGGDYLWEVITTPLMDILSWFYDFFGWVLDGLIWVISTLFCFLITGVFSIILTLLGSFDFLSAGVMSVASAGLPPQFAYFFSAVGGPQFFTIIAGAYFIRVMLNLIPASFTRV